MLYRIDTAGVRASACRERKKRKAQQRFCASTSNGLPLMHDGKDQDTGAFYPVDQGEG